MWRLELERFTDRVDDKLEDFLGPWKVIEDEPVLPPYNANKDVAQNIWNEWKQNLAKVTQPKDVLRLSPKQTRHMTIEVENKTSSKWLEPWAGLRLTVLDDNAKILTTKHIGFVMREHPDNKLSDET